MMERVSTKAAAVEATAAFEALEMVATDGPLEPGDNVPNFSIQEENARAKVADSLFSEIPLVGMFSGYVFHPSYLATRNDGTPVMRMAKQAAFWEGRFRIEKLGELAPREELNLFLSFLMLVLLERRRG